MSKQRKVTIGVGVIVVRDGKMLVTRRRKGSSWGNGVIAMPGGHIEEFETAYKCAIRECVEETGLVVRPFKINDYTYVVHAEEWFREGRHHWTVYLPATVAGGSLCNPEPHKHEPWQWKTLDELAVLCGPDDWIPIKALVVNREKIGL